MRMVGMVSITACQRVSVFSNSWYLVSSRTDWRGAIIVTRLFQSIRLSRFVANLTHSQAPSGFFDPLATAQFQPPVLLAAVTFFGSTAVPKSNGTLAPS